MEMQDNLKELLKAEEDVNKRVRKALEEKNEKLRSIKEMSAGDIDRFRAEKEKEYQRQYEAVRTRLHPLINLLVYS